MVSVAAFSSATSWKHHNRWPMCNAHGINNPYPGRSYYNQRAGSRQTGQAGSALLNVVRQGQPRQASASSCRGNKDHESTWFGVSFAIWRFGLFHRRPAPIRPSKQTNLIVKMDPLRWPTNNCWWKKEAKKKGLIWFCVAAVSFCQMWLWLLKI